ncbi:MAG: argininosuccinate lyase [Desulfohalobiaceae bacterium]
MMWSGRFSGDSHELMREFTNSLDNDRVFAEQDIQGSMAHARMLGKQGIIGEQEADQLISGLERIREEIREGSFPWRSELEDVHLNIERRLTEMLGQVGEKLHTGRSRNDQVALDLRLYVSQRVEQWESLLRRLARSLADQAERHLQTVMPGYTHLQPAQPVSLAHHLLAYVQMLGRDAQRLSQAQERIRVSPLGAAALAGTTYPVDPEASAREVGFERTFANSMDAVSDRDFVLEPLFCAATISTHLSRLCEELIFWANPSVGFMRLPDAFATGSSIMPQKKNPDIAELIRGKAAGTFGALQTMLSLLKGLPLAYNRDLQEDKRPFYQADEIVSGSLALMAPLIAEIEFLPERMRKAVSAGYLNATELADYLVGRGIPFRSAHHITGRAVAYAESRNMGLEDLTLQELRGFSEEIGEDVFVALDPRQAVARRNSPGGTGFEAVSRQLEEVRAWLDSEG